jgi:hypothetical protein
MDRQRPQLVDSDVAHRLIAVGVAGAGNGDLRRNDGLGRGGLRSRRRVNDDPAGGRKLPGGLAGGEEVAFVVRRGRGHGEVLQLSGFEAAQGNRGPEDSWEAEDRDGEENLHVAREG